MEKVQNPRPEGGGWPASRLWAKELHRVRGEVKAAWPEVETLLSMWSTLRLKMEGVNIWREAQSGNGDLGWSVEEGAGGLLVPMPATQRLKNPHPHSTLMCILLGYFQSSLEGKRDLSGANL